MDGMMREMGTARAVLKRGREGRARARHPWVYAGEIEALEGDPQPGSVVDVADCRRRFLGRGILNPASNIAVRILTWDDEDVDEAFFRRRISSAHAYREVVAPGAASRREVSSDGDMLSSLIADRYEDVCVVQTAALGMDVRKAMIARILAEVLGVSRVYERNDVRSRELEGLPLRSGFLLGGPFPTAFWTEENGFRFWVDIEKGQKTGLFLDQRENHRAIAPWCRGARVLDAFCYTGGFAVHAAGYGARSVLAIDSSEHALEIAKRTAEANGFSDVVSFRQANAFDALRELDAAGERFDLAIVDPPAFAPSRRTIDAAYRGYKEVNLRALRLLSPGGLLVTCSCSYHMTEDAFLQMLADSAADARRTARLVELRTQARDHPVLVGVDETRYLKCAVLRVE